MNPESCTRSDTPETDGEWNRLGDYDYPYFGEALVDFARKLERERDKAIRRIDVLATNREDWKRLAVEQERDINALQQELAIVRKQNNERLTILQENGLAEYGN